MYHDHAAIAIDIFSDALDLQGDERESYVADACSDAPELLEEVRSLLAVHERAHAGAFLESSTGAGFVGVPDTVVASGACEGRQIGRYKILEQLGEGGMGVVYLAQQDEPIRRRVALKIIKQGMDTKQVIIRFEAERQALAVMEHASIAKVYEAGVADTGRPYFVMEYVRGVSISDYCDQNKLTMRERLELFVQVCDAVQHAHQKGVIHRDIKPSNVLVTLNGSGPTPKLIDFGVAKAVGQPLTEQTLFTQHGQVTGTPDYMSPEQAQKTGANVDTRSDVYSLGVLLYRLLAGVLPFDPDKLRASGFEGVLHAIREVDPPKPSTRLRGLDHNQALVIAEKRRIGKTPAVRVLRGELDWITMKAMDKSPIRRYATASEFAADVKRYLNGHPVEAGRGSTAYVLGKLAKQYRVPLALAGTFAALILSFAIAMTVMHQRAVNAELRATEVKEFVKSMLASIDPAVARGNDTFLLRKMLDASAEMIDTDLAEYPEAQAELHQLIGVIYLKIGVYKKASRHLQTALDLRRELVTGDDADVAECMHFLAWALSEQSVYTSSERLYEEALRMRISVFGKESQQVAATRNDYGVMLHNKGELDRAEEQLRGALDLRLADPRTSPADRVESLATLGACLTAKRGRDAIKDAEGFLDEALKIAKEQLKDHPHTVSVMNKRGLLYLKQEEYVKAEELFTEALKLRRKVMGEKHEHVAVSQHNLALALYELGRLDEALDLQRQATRLWREVLGDNHPAAGFKSLARILRKMGETQEAVDNYREALRIQKNQEDPDQEQIQETQYVLARTLMDQKEYTFALDELKESEGRYTPAEHDRWKLDRIEAAIGRCQYQLQELEEAERRLLSAYLNLSEENGPDDPFTPLTIEVINWLIELYETTDREPQAEGFRALLRTEAGNVPAEPH